MSRVAWDISHREFTIEDHYYFSILKREATDRGIVIREVGGLDEIFSFDILVINYPEEKFSKDEVEAIYTYVEEGGRVIISGYYNNEDNNADAINSITEHFGLRILDDVVIDEHNNIDGDKYFIVTGRVYGFSKGVTRIVMPCVAPIKIICPKARVVAEAEDTAITRSGEPPILAACTSLGNGDIVLIGSCVFWDNYSIGKLDNLKFVLNMLLEQSIFK